MLDLINRIWTMLIDTILMFLVISLMLPAMTSERGALAFIELVGDNLESLASYMDDEVKNWKRAICRDDHVAASLIEDNLSRLDPTAMKFKAVFLAFDGKEIDID